jgi:hypothetical protein
MSGEPVEGQRPIIAYLHAAYLGSLPTNTFLPLPSTHKAWETCIYCKGSASQKIGVLSMQ